MDWLCPHICMGCGSLGAVLCECCKKDMMRELNCCPVCRQPVTRGVCEWCERRFDGFYMCGFRDGLLGDLISEYKYKSVRAVAGVLAELIDNSLPEMAGTVIVVPLPTVAKHVRQRGLDHTWLVGKKLARRRGWKCERILRRAADTVQVGATAKERRKQAERAYCVAGVVDKEATYVLLDDVWTTGASMLAAEKLLREAGAKKVVGAVLAVSGTA